MLNTIDTTQADIPASLAKVKPEETRRMKIWLDDRIAAGKKKPSTEIVTLTPVLASLIMEHNPINRPISRRGDPILYCRNRLIGGGRGMPAHSRIELIFKCWNAYRMGHGVDHCKLTGKLPKIEK
jgi:hypothetical protein